MAVDFFIEGLNPEVRNVIRLLLDMDDFETVINRSEEEKDSPTRW